MKRILGSTALGLFLISGFAYSMDNPCGPDNMIINLDEGSVACNIDMTITEANGKTLAAETFGIVRSVRVKVDLKAYPSRYDLYLSEQGIQIPSQRIEFHIETNGTPITGSVNVSPKIKIQNGPDGVEATGADLGATDFQSTLPDWIDRIIEKRANQAGSEALLKPAKDFVKKTFN